MLIFTQRSASLPVYCERAVTMAALFLMLQLFNEIWEERDHISELSGKPLLPKGHFQWHWQFLHILSKSYPSFKYDKRNIILALPEEHAIQERFPKFIELRESLRAKYYEEVYGKVFE